MQALALGFDSAASREEAQPHHVSGSNQLAHGAVDIPDDSIKASLSLLFTVPHTVLLYWFRLLGLSVRKLWCR